MERAFQQLLAYLMFNPFGLLLLIFFIPIIRVIRKLSITRRVIKQGGICVEESSISANEYYERMLERFQERKIGLSTHYTNLPEGSLLMSSRKYLVVKKESVMFYICTFNVGNTQAFTYWQIAPLNFFLRLFGGIPFIGWFLVGIFMPMTLYKMDLASTLLTIIEGDIKAVTEEMGVNKGVRALGETDFKQFRKAYAV